MSNVVHVDFSAAGRRRLGANDAYAMYEQACTFDSDPAKTDLAAAVYRRALEIDPDLWPAAVNLGNMHHRAGRAHEAVGIWLQVLERFPDVSEAAYNLGYVSHEGGLYSAAVNYYCQALKSHPDFPEAHHNLAVSLLELGDSAQAAKSLRRLLKLQPDGDLASSARRLLKDIRQKRLR